MIELTDKTFKTEIEDHTGYAVIDFYTPQCGPCKTIAPAFKTAEEKYPNVKFVKVEPAEGYEVFKKFNVTAVPHFILFKDGKEHKRQFLSNGPDLEKWLTENAK